MEYAQRYVKDRDAIAQLAGTIVDQDGAGVGIIMVWVERRLIERKR